MSVPEASPSDFDTLNTDLPIVTIEASDYLNPFWQLGQLATETIELMKLQGHDNDRFFRQNKRRMERLNGMSDAKRIRLLVQKGCNVGMGTWDWQEYLVSIVLLCSPEMINILFLNYFCVSFSFMCKFRNK